MQHHVVDRCVGKAEKHFAGDGPAQFVVVEQIGEQPIGVVPADGAEDHVNPRVAERLQKVGGARLRVRGQVVDAAPGVGHKADIYAVPGQALQPNLDFVLRKRLSQHAAGQADDSDVSNHGDTSL